MYCLPVLGYYVVSESLFSTTIGKRLLGLVIVDAEEEPIGIRKAIVRNLMRPIALATLYVPSILVNGGNERSQHLSDLLAGTVVVKRSQLATGGETGADESTSPDPQRAGPSPELADVTPTTKSATSVGDASSVSRVADAAPGLDSTEETPSTTSSHTAATTPGAETATDTETESDGEADDWWPYEGS